MRLGPFLLRVLRNRPAYSQQKSGGRVPSVGQAVRLLPSQRPPVCEAIGLSGYQSAMGRVAHYLAAGFAAARGAVCLALPVELALVELL
jgi:hypothetical protein